jgi:hypothetical protein
MRICKLEMTQLIFENFLHSFSLISQLFSSHDVFKTQLSIIILVVYCLFTMKVSVLLFLMLFCFINCDDPLPCRFNDGSFGKCVDIKNCRSLYGLYRQGTVRVKDLPICDPVKRLVCCPRISSKSKNDFYLGF